MLKTYLTTQGDTWDSIAFKFYGNENYMTELINANTEHLNVVIFPSNIVLNIPEVTAKKSNDLILPWR